MAVVIKIRYESHDATV